MIHPVSVPIRYRSDNRPFSNLNQIIYYRTEFTCNKLITTDAVQIQLESTQSHNMNFQLSVQFLLKNRRLSNWYRIATNTGCIVSNQLLLYLGKPDITCIITGSAAVNGSHYKGRSNGVSTVTCRSHAQLRTV